MNSGADALLVLAVSGVAAVSLFAAAIWRRSWRIWLAGFAALTVSVVFACLEHRKAAVTPSGARTHHSPVVVVGGYS